MRLLAAVVRQGESIKISVIRERERGRYKKVLLETIK